MAIEIVEQVKSQQVSDKQGTRLYICYTTAGETSVEIHTEIKTTVPSHWSGKQRKNIQVNPTKAPHLFFAVVSYGVADNDTQPDPILQTTSMSFQYHTEQMFSALKTQGWRGDGVAVLPDIKDGILVPKDKPPQGISVQKAGLVLGINTVVSSMPNAYVQDLARLAMCVNESTFNAPGRTFAKGTAQFDPFWYFWAQDCSGADPSEVRHIAAFRQRIYPEADLNDTLPPSGIIVR